MGEKKKPPDDFELFRREVGDVRPLKFEKRVPSESPRAKTKQAKAANQRQNSGQESPGSTKRCPGAPDKKIYESRDEAIKAAQYVTREWLKEVRPYHCFFCGKYHLTSKTNA